MIMDESMDVCAICKNKAETKCSGCNVISYCSIQHLKEHSNIHKPNCKPYIISKNKLLGRFLQASRNIKQGEVIFQEKPIVVGPGENSASHICFSCGGFSSTRCSGCNVALICGQTCSGKGHSTVECDLYKKTSEKLKSTNFLNKSLVLPIRCVINLNTPNEKWHNFLNLESHNDKRRGSSIWNIHHKTIVQVLQKWGLISKNVPDEERVQTIMGVLDVNSFEVRCGIENRGRALYLEASLMTHDCFPNCIVAVDKHFMMTVKARRDIPAGHLITYCYTNTLYGTAMRQTHLSETKYFFCECSRCKDPTELGTHLSSLVCPRCRKGLITFNSEKKYWICCQCLHEFSNGLINATLNQAQYIIDDLNKSDTKDVENTLAKLSKSLAPNHSYLIDLKQLLAVLYRQQKPNIQILEKRRKLCQELLSVINILEPGISRLRGIALYEIQGILSIIAELKQNDLTLLHEAEVTLKEAVSLLLHEPPDSPEGSLARQALSELKFLRENIQQIEKFRNKKKIN